MEKMFTKLTGTILLSGLLLTSFNSNAQTSATTAPTTYANTDAKSDKTAATSTDTKTETKSAKKADDVDTTWKPQRRVWGYAFGDLYFNQHSPIITSTQGKENNYYQVPSNRNAFQFRRIYLGYDYEITKKFKAEFLLSSEPTANTGVVSATTATVQNGDNLADGKMGLFIKNINLRVRDLWNGTDVVVGEMSTPGFALNEAGTNAPTTLSENVWGLRSIERTVTDFHKNNSYDLGAALQGTFDPKTKNFGYVLMVGNNSTSSLLSAANANTGFYKIFYGDIWGKFAGGKIVADVYADYAQTSPSTPLGTQEHNMLKGFVAYTTPALTIGVEAYTQTFKNGVSIKSTPTVGQNAKAQGLSVFAKAALVKSKLNVFARYDSYNPYTNFVSADVYAANTNYGSYDPNTKEKFVTAGLDFTPVKNVHFMPNVWFVQYKDQLNATDQTTGAPTAGYFPDNHTLVYRLTFFYTFGK